MTALRTFESAARLRFKLAAAELAVTPTAVSHQALEQRVGVALFERCRAACA